MSPDCESCLSRSTDWWCSDIRKFCVTAKLQCGKVEKDKTPKYIREAEKTQRRKKGAPPGMRYGGRQMIRVYDKQTQTIYESVKLAAAGAKVMQKTVSCHIHGKLKNGMEPRWVKMEG